MQHNYGQLSLSEINGAQHFCPEYVLTCKIPCYFVGYNHCICKSGLWQATVRTRTLCKLHCFQVLVAKLNGWPAETASYITLVQRHACRDCSRSCVEDCVGLCGDPCG